MHIAHAHALWEEMSSLRGGLSLLALQEDWVGAYPYWDGECFKGSIDCWRSGFPLAFPTFPNGRVTGQGSRLAAMIW